MPDNRIDWGELVSEIASLGVAERDDEANDERDDERDDDSEAVSPSRAFRPGVLSPNVTRARPGNYAQAVRGQSQGVVQTPSGPARIELPGRFPTVDEFKQSVEAIQKDVKQNSDGIRELAALQRRDSLRLAELVNRSERRMKRQLKRTQIISIAAAAVLPFVGRFIDQKLNP